MAEPSDADSLLEAIRNLMSMLERVRQLLDEQSHEVRGLSGALQALQQQGQHLLTEVEELRRDQTALSRDFIRLETRVDEQDRRLTALEQRPAEAARPAAPPEPQPEPASGGAGTPPPDATATATPSPGGRPSNLIELAQRVDRLERKEEVLLRIIELVVERAWIVARRNAGGT